MARIVKLRGDWQTLLEMIIYSDQFKRQIDSKGFFLTEDKRNFKEYCKEIMDRSFGTEYGQLFIKGFLASSGEFFTR